MGFDRRQLIVAGAAGGISALVGAEEVAAHDGPHPEEPPQVSPFGSGAAVVIAGEIVGRGARESFLVQTAEGQVRVIIGPDCIYSAPLRGPHSLRPRTEIAAEGVWIETTFEARAIAPLLHFVTATVLERRGNSLRTTAGSVRFDDTAVRFVSETPTPVTADHFAVGDKLVGFGWRESSPNTLTLVRVE